MIWRKANWNPKETVLKTCVTLLFLSYSKFLFVSINLLLAVPVYDCRNESVPVSTVLLYDPSIRFLHSEHIPYVIISVFVIIVFVLLPACLILVSLSYKVFSVFLRSMGFKRWDILHMVMDIFQGWFKNGTDNGNLDSCGLQILFCFLYAS